ncbi:MAG: hypothetical protein JWO32_1906 [Bacteroidetes bacterium]|jgi:hypothetical protein|nr:hypothetical protein [Bacteroidota bacterium]
MNNNPHYYTLLEAEKLKQTYSSWINKKAHLSEGQFEILKRITIKPAPVSTDKQHADLLHSVQFEFTNSRKVDAKMFLINNGLANIDKNCPTIEALKKNTQDVNL